MTIPALTGLDLLGTAIVLVDQHMNVHYANPSAENLFEASSKSLVGHNITEIFQDDVLDAAIDYARANHSSYTENDLRIGAFGRPKLMLSCTANPVEIDGWTQGGHGFLLEFRHIEQQMKIAREERLLDQSQANRELIRNLAHEIKNPLGGIRGAAQLLERELERPHLHEYTQVIMKEADRLQLLAHALTLRGRASAGGQPAVATIRADEGHRGLEPAAAAVAGTKAGPAAPAELKLETSVQGGKIVNNTEKVSRKEPASPWVMLAQSMVCSNEFVYLN